MNNFLDYFESFGTVGVLICILCILYGILNFLMPFFILTINSKIDSLNNQIKMLQKRSDDIAYILIHQVDEKTANEVFKEETNE